MAKHGYAERGIEIRLGAAGGIGEPLSGRLLCINTLDMTFYEAACEKRKDCAICGDQPKITRIEQNNYRENITEECGL